MPKYYVAGIPFDSENALKHYGVKGMKWDQHLFGPDANTKYINWMDNIGKFAGNAVKAVDNAASNSRNGVYGAANQAGRLVSNTANNDGRAVSPALNNASNFLTGNQPQQNVQKAKNSFIIGRDGRVAKAQSEYGRTLPGMIENTVNAVGKAASGVSNNVRNWVGNAVNNVGGSDSSNTLSDKPAGVSDEFWREYTYNGGTRAEYDAQREADKRRAQATNNQESQALSDKPAGVSDEYWREYTYNGR